MASNIDDFTVACEVGDLTWIKRCLRGAIDVRERNSEGVTGLHMVCREWHLDCLRYLLDHCNVDVDSASTAKGETPLHLAVRKTTAGNEQKCVQVVKVLLERGADSNKRSFSGQTPLHATAHIGCVPLVKLLLHFGADILVKDNNGLYPLDMSELGGHHEVSRLLHALHWASNKEDSTNRSLLQGALRKEMVSIERERASRERHYKAVRAYDAWQESKNIVGRSHVDPGACQYRLEERSRQSTSSCSTCVHSRAASHTSYASQKSHVKPINISLHQVDRNLKGIGKPGNIYPYSNYPTLETRKYGPRPPSTKARPKSGTTRTHRKKKTSDTEKEVTRPHKPKPPPLDLRAISVTSDEGSLDDEVPDSPGELTFHEVEQNSLRGISSSAYIQQLLGDSGDPSSANTLINFHNHRHNAYRGKLQRRLSLGAIPEGRIVHYAEGSEEFLDLWGDLSWRAALSTQRRYSSAPTSPVTDNSPDNSLLSVLRAMSDQEEQIQREELRFDVCSEGSDSDSEEEGRGVPRPDTPLPSLNQEYCMRSLTPPPDSPRNLSSPSSPLLTSTNSLEQFSDLTSKVDPDLVRPPSPTEVWTASERTPSDIVPLQVSGGRITPSQRDTPKRPAVTRSSAPVQSQNSDARQNTPRTASHKTLRNTHQNTQLTSQSAIGIAGGLSPRVPPTNQRQIKSASSLRQAASQDKVALKPTVMEFGGALKSVNKKVALVYSWPTRTR